MTGQQMVPPDKFQSTLPAWGSDYHSTRSMSLSSQFQSTLPAWGSDRNIWC